MSEMNENYFEYRHKLGLTLDDCKYINRSCRFINSFIKKQGLRYTYNRSFVSVLKTNKHVRIKYNALSDQIGKDLLLSFFYKHFPKSIISTKCGSITVDITPYMTFI
jgi:hypothetical protein